MLRTLLVSLRDLGFSHRGPALFVIRLQVLEIDLTGASKPGLGDRRRGEVLIVVVEELYKRFFGRVRDLLGEILGQDACHLDRRLFVEPLENSLRWSGIADPPIQKSSPIGEFADCIW